MILPKPLDSGLGTNMSKAAHHSDIVDSLNPRCWRGKRLHHHGGGICWLFVLLWMDSWCHELIVCKNEYKNNLKMRLTASLFDPPRHAPHLILLHNTNIASHSLLIRKLKYIQKMPLNRKNTNSLSLLNRKVKLSQLMQLHTKENMSCFRECQLFELCVAIDYHERHDRQLANLHQIILFFALCIPSSLLPNWAWSFNRKPSLQGSYFHHVSNLLLQLCHKFDQELQDKMKHLCQWQLHILHFQWNSWMLWFDFQHNLSSMASQALIV